MKIGMIFPGQGSQFVGMAKEFYDNERLVQEYFEQASSCLNQNFVKLCFASSEKELMETVNTQTSIFLVSASIYSLLKEKYSIKATLFAGHSLGEYSAVFAAGGINFPDGLYLLKKRALFMEEATRTTQGGMLAVLNCTEAKLRPIVEKYNIPGSDDAVAEIVNYNSPRQLVVSGTLSLLDKLPKMLLKLKGGQFY
jgi:[acyl-carrier-protein] S-malonyltransferase